MALISSMLFSVLIIQAFSTAAPSDDNVETPKNHVTLDISNEESNQRNVENESNNKREKRFYDYIDYKYPPFYPPSFPYPGQGHYSKRDESSHTGVYGTEEDTVSLIFRRLRDILADARQHATPPPVQRPPVTHFTGFIPVIYIPSTGCSCTNTEYANPTSTPANTPQSPFNNNNQNPDNKATTPVLDKRFPEIEDKRQNWGILVNGSQATQDPGNDGNRPISFDPVIPDEAINVKVPPVEHGSVQAGREPETIVTTTYRPPIIPTYKTTPYPAAGSSNAPNICDTAIIACCVHSTMPPNCFKQHGCLDTSIYGDPCAPSVILKAIDKVEFFIKQRTG